MYKKLFIFLFILFASCVFYLGNAYKKVKVDESTSSKYEVFAKSLNTELGMYIKEKQNATLAIAVSMARGHNLAKVLQENNKTSLFLEKLSQSLKNSTDFKNVWIQLIDKNGINHSRSWTSKRGDDLAKIRPDVVSMIQNPKISSSISIGWFDLSFKAMVPITNEYDDFIGFVEVVTHFNSIAQKLKDKSYEPLIVVDAKYKSQLHQPFSKTFAKDNYIANVNADKTLVTLLTDKGITNFVSPTKNYTIYKNYFILNHPILDASGMFLANFLVFVPLQALELDFIHAMHTNINLLMLFSLFLGAFLFFSVYNSLGKTPIHSPHKYTWIFIVIFFNISGIYIFLLSWNFGTKKEEVILSHNQNIQRDFKIINNNFSRFAHSMYTLIIDKPEIVSILAKAYEGKEQKDKARQELYELLAKEYAYLQGLGLRQLHFQLKDNESFLRFHRPKKFGDNLTGIRATIEYVNKNLLPIEGFEEGRIFNGFRHVYPLFTTTPEQERIHLGSVEISFSAYVLAHEFTQSHDAKASFIISKKIVDHKVFSHEQSNYIDSEFDGFLYEATIKKQLEKTFAHIDITKLNTADITYASRHIYGGDVFSCIAKDNKSIFTFVPFKNPISKKVASAIILQEDTNEMIHLLYQYYLLLFFGITTIFFAMLYIYKEFTSRHIYESLSKKTQNILDAQDAIVIVTNGISIIDVNKKFFDFFGQDTLDAFKKDHACICECFEKDPKFFYLKSPNENGSWIHEFLKLPSKAHLVSMKNHQNKAHSFAVSISGFEEDYVISFSDISDTIDEHFSLEEKATHDNLTNAYNREYFDKVLPRMLQETHTKNMKLGVIIFDIDHFKHVNDTYGHNTGDAILKHLVKMVHTTIRAEDILIRWGGEEFIILAKTTSLENVGKLAEHIRQSVAKEHFEDVEHITCSFGVTLFHSQETIQACIQRADEALYHAKNDGRNRVVLQS